MKRLSTRAHGVLDLITAGTLVALPRVCGWGDGVTGLLTKLGVGSLGYSMLTDYEFGMVRVLPMRAHLALDALSGATLCAAPWMFPEEDDTTRAALVGLGVFEIGAALLTRPVPDDAADRSAVEDALGRGTRAAGSFEKLRQSSTSAAL